MARQSQAGRDSHQIVLGHGTEASQGRRSENQPAAVVPYPDEARIAFLDEHPLLARNAAGLEPGMRGTKGGMAREWQLFPVKMRTR